MDALSGFGWLLMAVGAALAAVAVGPAPASRARRRAPAAEVARVTAAVAGTAVVADVASFYRVEGIAQIRIAARYGVGFAAFPLAAGVAILRYRLYDIDVVINRALVYASSPRASAAPTWGSVLAASARARARRSDLADRWLDARRGGAVPPRPRADPAVVDRRFFRRRYDAAQTLDAFGARLRDELDLDALARELRPVVAGHHAARPLSLWLRSRRVSRPPLALAAWSCGRGRSPAAVLLRSSRTGRLATTCSAASRPRRSSRSAGVHWRARGAGRDAPAAATRSAGSSAGRASPRAGQLAAYRVRRRRMRPIGSAPRPAGSAVRCAERGSSAWRPRGLTSCCCSSRTAACRRGAGARSPGLPASGRHGAGQVAAFTGASSRATADREPVRRRRREGPWAASGC